MISLPKDWKTYSNSIFERCNDLIDMKVWSGLDKTRIGVWRNNFTSDEEKYFSACILDSLIYRSNQQTYSLIHQLLHKCINNFFRVQRREEYKHLLQKLMGKGNLEIRLVSSVTPFDPPGKSTHIVLRDMKRLYKINPDYIIAPWNIPNAISDGVTLFIFIDDFLGTGNQFSDVLIHNRIDFLEKSSILFIYAPLVAHHSGIKYLKDNHPYINLVWAEKLDTSHSFFENYFAQEIDLSKEFYLQMLSKRGISLPEGSEFGYGDLSLTYAFEHAVPDNSLTILHLSDNWRPLFNR